jgi:transposase
MAKKRAHKPKKLKVFSQNRRISKRSFKLNPKEFKKCIRRLNPSILYFTITDRFIYEPTQSNYFYEELSDKNIVKPQENEINFLDNEIKSLLVESDPKNVYVLPFFASLMDNIKIISPKLNDRALKIQEIIQKWPRSTNISIRRITEEYNNYALSNNKNTIQKSLVHEIMKNLLKYKYKKTSVKTDKLISKNSIKLSFYFLKVLLRALINKISLVFIDESGFYTKNNNYRTWRTEAESIFFPVNDSRKINLIMGVSSERVLHYNITTTNTTSKTFKKFMEELLKKMTKEEKKRSLFIMDNCSCHLTAELFQLYHTNNLKILFNIPYMSNFNLIENVFRILKNNTYKKLFKSYKGLMKDLPKIINDKINEEVLKKLYKNVLLEYYNYILKNKSNNLNE